MGTTTEQIEKEQKREASDSDKALAKTVQNLFMITYTNPASWVLEMSDQDQLELFGPYFEALLYKIKDRLDNAEYPKEFFELEKIADNVPLVFFDKYEEALESYIAGIEAYGFEPED